MGQRNHLENWCLVGWLPQKLYSQYKDNLNNRTKYSFILASIPKIIP